MKKTSEAVRLAKHRAQRRRLRGTAARPRLGLYKSGKYTYAFIVDDGTARVLVSRSTQKLEPPAGKSRATVPAAELLGKELGAAAKAAGITKVVFDRSGYTYHGRVKAVADGARAAGLNF